LTSANSSSLATVARGAIAEGTDISELEFTSVLDVHKRLLDMKKASSIYFEMFLATASPDSLSTGASGANRERDRIYPR